MQNEGKRQTNYAQILNIKCIVVHVIASTYYTYIGGRDVHNPGQKLLPCKWWMANGNNEETGKQTATEYLGKHSVEHKHKKIDAFDRQK